MVNKNSFMFTHHFSRQLAEILGSLIRYLNVADNNRHLSLLAVHGYNYYIYHNSVYVLLRVRLFTSQLWRLLFRKQSGVRYLKPKYFRRTRTRRRRPVYYNIRKCIHGKRRWLKIRPFNINNLHTALWRFTKKRVYAVLSRDNIRRTHLLVNRARPRSTPRAYTRVSKKMWKHFLILPYLFCIKQLVVKTIFSKLERCASVKVLFLGLNQRSLNANMIIEFIVCRLRYRQFRISRLIYDILRILKCLIRMRKLGGYKFLLAGRFSRRDRATYVWKGYSSLPLSTKLSSIDYQYRLLQMRYSMGMLKLWINYC